jgi:molecular chaperone DnaJ
MSEKRDYYEVLGVTRTSLDDEIQKAYRKLAMNYHPDRNPGDKDAEARFKEATEAFEVLSDTEKRQHYNHFGHGQSFRQQSSRNPGDVFSDFFADAFRQEQRRPTSRDVQIDMDVEFMEAAIGCNKVIRFERNEPCGKCNGEGAESPEDLEKCKLCDGQGQVIQGNSFMRLQSTCPQCRGRGKIIKIPCQDCQGHGQITSPAELQVKVPEGAFDGMRLCVRGQGEVLQIGGTRGDLYLRVNTQPHHFFNRDDDNLICCIPITFTNAVLGGKIEIQGIKEVVEVNIPPGTQSGTILRVRGHGLVDVYYPTKRGDLLVKFDVETPSHLEPEYREFVEKLAELEKKYPGEKITAYNTSMKGNLNGTDSDMVQ